MFIDINRIAELAKEDPKRQFSSIAHLITGEKLYEAFRSLRKNASAGIDGVTYQQYETNAEENIRQLHQRLREGKYRHSHCDVSIFRRKTGNRGRSRFPRSRIRSCRQWRLTH